MQRHQPRFADVAASDPYKQLRTFADAVLRTEDGGQFKIHRILLAQRSVYFRALFCGDFPCGPDVLLRGIDGQTLEDVLVYLYTGTVALDQGNALDVMVAADYLLVDPLLQESRSFALREMSPYNCVAVFLTAWRIERLGILDRCYRYMVVHFEEVVQCCSDFGELPLEALQKFLEQKSLNISGERTVWNAIVKWTEFRPHERVHLVPELLKWMNLEDMDETLVEEILSHPTVDNNLFCNDLILPAHSSKLLRNFQSTLGPKCFMSGSRCPTKLYLIAYYIVSYKGTNTELYLTCDGEIDFWRKIATFNSCPEYLVQLGHHVYMFDTWITKSVAFDILEEKCVPMTPLSKGRCRYSVVCIGDYIYVIGGVFEAQGEEDIERFDPSTGKWDLISRMVPMALCDAVAMDGHIYAIGDVGGDYNPTMMVQVYDPSCDTWSSVQAPKLVRHDFAAVAFRGHLYLIGGEAWDHALKTTEEYDPVQDAWMSLPDLPAAYIIPKAIVLKDVLIVYEENMEYRSCNVTTPPVCWDVENRKWHVISESSPLYMVHLYQFCTITEPKVVERIVKRNRHQDNKWVKSYLTQ
ncbi:kelch-like protein 21 [Caerostris darwini]|uniref:Kelch-like protein diablo n=1 Tax=Caerostris darwini TaxID=1538125 RepID=A0AAV4QEE3_9ARAC|nr:kelch-like protein 21 [Caerostris darwini]